MIVKCPECGFEDEGKYCSNCGALLPQPDIPIEQKSSKVPDEISWLDKCPVCKLGRLSVLNKGKFFNAVSAENIKCENCGAIFVKKGEKFRLTKVPDTSNTIWKDYGNKELTEREWKNIAFEGLSDDKQKEADMEFLLEELREGKIPLRIEGEAPVILKKNEDIQIVLPNISLVESRAIRTGYYRGPSVRLVKGVYYRFGKSISESHDELRTIDRGTLILTNKRLIFSGSKNAINIELKKIVSMEPYSDGIALNREGKQKTQYFADIDQAVLTFTVDDRQYTEPLSGLILMYLIEGLTKRME